MEPRRVLSATPLLVTHTGDSGPGSLRAALDYANTASLGADSITFNIPASDPNFVDVDSHLAGGDAVADAFVIQPQSALPALTDNETTIDGRTQTAFTGNTNPFGPEIVIDGGKLSGSQSGILRILSHNNQVFDLNLQNFRGYNDGLQVFGTNNWIAGNYIGTDPTGTIPRGNGRDGVLLHFGGSSNLIGTDADGIDDAAERNVISGNDRHGIFVVGVDRNVVAGNHVGTNATGDSELGNGSSGVVLKSGASKNIIGVDDTIGGVSSAQTNVISGNGNSGVRINDATTDNMVAGNYIGTNSAGDGSLGNRQGILIFDNATANVIGTDGDGQADLAERNVISGNQTHGVVIRGSGTIENVVAGNYIGTNADGAASVANRVDGIHVTGGAQSNLIGTDGDGTADEAERNLISGNANDGIEISGAGADENIIAGNYIGTDVSGSNGIGNGHNGIWINGPARNRIGGTGAHEGNLIADSRFSGVALARTTDTVVQGNLIGTDASGSNPIGNGAVGVWINSGSNNLVGGSVSGAGNVISASASHGVQLLGQTQDNVVAGNFIGTDVSGTIALGNGSAGWQAGVFLGSGAEANRIGTDGDGVNDATERNVISGNRGSGVRILHAGTNHNTVAGNYIGTDVTGQTALSNGNTGIVIANGARENLIGTNGDGVSDELERNVISGNTSGGVGISGSGTRQNTVAGNYIGTDVSGTSALGNGSESWHNAVLVGGGAAGNLIGTNGDGTADAAERNVISGNRGRGVLIVDGAFDNTVAGNYIGTDANGQAALGNGNEGVLLMRGASNNVIGTDGDGVADQAERNVIAASGSDGLAMYHAGTSRNIVAGNYIGTDATGSQAVPNNRGSVWNAGVKIGAGASDNLVGSDGDGVADQAERNVISGNLGRGLFLDGASENVVAGNYVGTDVTGQAAMGNGKAGVFIRNGADNLIGTDGDGVSDVLEGNVISGNGGDGISIQNSDRNLVAGNYVGVSATGMAALGNAGNGVTVGGSYSNVIGTNGDGMGDEAEGNVISANQRYAGIFMSDAHQTVIAGNLIGTDASGATALGNDGNGIEIKEGSSLNRIGTNGDGVSDIGERNVISGNSVHGVWLWTQHSTEKTRQNVVAGNFIGTDITGDVAMGNGTQPWHSGVLISNGAKHNRIGTDGDGTADAAERNLISGNMRGLAIDHAESQWNIVAGNYIGTNASGTAAIGTPGTGVVLWHAKNNTVGTNGDGSNDAAEANLIAFNGEIGVGIFGEATGNTIRRNAIHSNAGLGIDIDGDGVTANDRLDADSGANQRLNFPGIGSVSSGTTTRVTGSYHGAPDATFTLDFYANPDLDSSDSGEGRRYLGSATVTTDADGHAPIDVTLAAVTTGGEFVTVTATDSDGSTSEFSNWLPAGEAGGPYLLKEGGSMTLDASASSDPEGSTLTYAWDFDGDGMFDDATGATPTFSAANLDGPTTAEVRVQVTDATGLFTEDAATIEIINVAPSADMSGPTAAVPGQPLTFTLTASDPSLADQAASFTFHVDWDGDGAVDETVNGPSGTEIEHAFNATGAFSVSVTATDKDSGTSLPAVHGVTVADAALLPDDCHDGQSALYVGGTTGDDDIRIKPVGNTGEVDVLINGTSQGEFAPSGRIVVYGQAGDDDVQISGSIDLAAWLYGGTGDDRLKGGGGNDVVLGEDGDDLLLGKRGRDLLVGGRGADRIVGNSDDDILIAGWLDFADRERALCDIMKEWTSGDYHTRIENLSSTLVLGQTVREDSDRDLLTGASGDDWFFFDEVDDEPTDLKEEVFANDLDWITSGV